jgi:ATP-binding cassette subfamily B protein/subfamily B ATP-binding cassette protein MsbA
VNAQGETLPRLSGQVEFQDACFSYEPGRPTLAHIRLTVRAGETIALVGKNGCGKSTRSWDFCHAFTIRITAQ